MSSSKVPQTPQYVHIFNGEFEQLKSYQKQPIENGLCCYLYGLWTHSSNVVIHLVVSNQTEQKYAQTHRLDCVGYVAMKYSADLYDMVKCQTKLSTRRQHIIVDVNETDRTDSLQAFASHSKREDPLRQGQRLKVKILPSKSPFRNELYKKNPEMKTFMNGHKSESENDLRSHSKVHQVSQELPAKVGNESQLGKELYDMNRGSGGASKNENCIESETATYHGNQTNGHQDKIDQSSSLFKSLEHKIKKEFELKNIPVEEHPEKSSLVLHFKHNGKQWQIELKEDQSSDKTLVEIFFSELTEVPLNPVKACSQEFRTSQPVIDKIKELCQCEKCKKIN